MNNQNHNQNHYDGNTIGGFVCGIISCLTFWYSGANFVSLALGIVGLILCINARKVKSTGLSTAGYVLSIVGTVLSAISLFACTLCGTCGILTGFGCLACLAL